MKLNISKEEKEEGSEKEVYLKFKYGSNDTVVVCACDKEGNPFFCGNLIGFYPDGTIRKIGSVNPDLGFQLDEDGRIKG